MNTPAPTRRAYVALAVTLVTFATAAYAATFPYFSPATGILKGNASTYVTTAAASSDVIGLWTGTCNGSSALKGDGTCGTLAAGTVSSVDLTMPSGFSVSGNPVTTSGTLAVTTALNGVLKGNGSGFTTAASSDVIGLWTGTCNSGTFLRADGTCQSPASGSPGGADTNVQFNNAGAFSGTSEFTWTNANRTLRLGSTGAGVLSMADFVGTGLGLTVRAGASQNAGSTGGTLTLTSGTPAAGGPGGPLIIQATSGVGAGAAGGNISINSGSGVGGFSGGTLSAAAGSGGSTNGNGGNATFLGGSGGTTGGNGGNATVLGGTATDGNGGNANLTAAAGTGTNRNGGSVVITAGANTGSGTAGLITFSQAAVNMARLQNGRDFTVGSTAAATHSGAGRSTIAIDGTTDAALDLSVGGTFKGYLYSSASEMRVGAAASTPINFYPADTNRWTMAASGGMFAAGATGGDQGVGTLNASGLFVNGVAVGGSTTTSTTFTLGGCSAGTTGTISFYKIGKMVQVSWQNRTCTSTGGNQLLMAFTYPAGYEPTVNAAQAANVITNNNTEVMGKVIYSTSTCGGGVCFQLVGGGAFTGTVGNYGVGNGVYGTGSYTTN